MSDTGVGIPDDALPRVFDRFYRVGPLPQPSHGGTGLGLSIARAVVERHGGTVEATSAARAGQHLPGRPADSSNTSQTYE